MRIYLIQASIIDSESGKRDDELQRLQAEVKKLSEDNAKLRVSACYG